MAKAIPTNTRAIRLVVLISFGGIIYSALGIGLHTVSISLLPLFSIWVVNEGFLFGYNLGVISGCLIMPDFINRFGQIDMNGNMYLSSTRQSIITSMWCAGTFFGALCQAFTSDRFGRRGSILIWTLIFTVGGAIQTGTQRSLSQITAGRFVGGLGVGALSAIVPLYMGETAPKALRGSLLVVYQIQIMFGVFLTNVIELGTHNFNNSASWRIPLGLQMAWGLILLIGFSSLPESPRHLLGTGRQGEARQVVANLNGININDSLVDVTIEELEFAIRAENEGGKATWMECFSTRNALWKRTINGIMLQCLQQLNGQNFYYFYGDTFFQSAGTTLDPYSIQTILGAVAVIGTLPALHLIESMGRRRSLLIGALLEATCAIITGLVGRFMLAPAGTPKALLTPRNIQGGDVLITFAVLHVFTFGLAWGSTPWVYLGESFPLRVRPKCIALGSAMNWIWNFLLSFFAPRIVQSIGPLIMLIFFGVLLLAWVYVYLFVPETKGISLEEVDELYRSGVKPWNSANWKPRLMEELHKQMDAENLNMKSKDSQKDV